MKKFIETAKAYNKILEKQTQEFEKRYNRYFKTQTGYVYKLTSKQTEKIYIGSTTKKLNKRFSAHKYDFKRWQNGKYRYVSSFELCKYDDCQIELIAQYCNITKFQLEKYECTAIKNETSAINKCNVGCGWSENPKEYQKQYYKENADMIKKRLNKKNTCEICGGEYTTSHKQQHFKTKKHQKAKTQN